MALDKTNPKETNMNLVPLIPMVNPAQWTTTTVYTGNATTTTLSPRIRYEYLSDDLVYDVYQKIILCGKWNLSMSEPTDYLRSASRLYGAFIKKFPDLHDHNKTSAVRLTCLFMSIKYLNDEAYGMRIGKFVKFVNERTTRKFVAKKVCDLERFILKSLDYNLRPIME